MADKVDGVKTPAEKVKDFLARSAEYERAAADMVFKTEAASPGSNAGDAITQLRYAIEVLADVVFSGAKDSAVKETRSALENAPLVVSDDRLVVDKNTPSIIEGVGGYSFNKALCTVCDNYAHQFRSSGIRSISFEDDHPNDKIIIALDSGIKLTLTFDYLEYTVEV